jgi:hypothetical protein
MHGHFGFYRDTWTDAIRRGELRARFRSLRLELMFEQKMSRGSIKRRLLELRLIEERCSRGGVAQWRGKPLRIQLDHINGVPQPNPYLRWTKRKAALRGPAGVSRPPMTPTLPSSRRRYDWTAVQEFYEKGWSLRRCMMKFGFCRASWHKAVKRGEIRPRRPRSLEGLLAHGKARGNIKNRLIRAGLLTNRCQECGLTEWLGHQLAIQIDHITGERLPPRKPPNALPKLPQPDGDVR